MHTIINPPTSDSRESLPDTAPAGAYRKPNYDCREQADALELVIYVPGTDAAGVEVAAQAPDLVVTARKSRFVRSNWQAASLETLRPDYRLRLRLGRGFDYQSMRAEIQNGVLTVILPKRERPGVARAAFASGFRTPRIAGAYACAGGAK
jgi:HSP20 family molecular chaperone IbpA